MSSSEWREVKLSDVCDFQEGYVNPSQKNPEYFGDEIKWVRANDLNNGYIFETSRKLSLAGFNSAGKSALLFEPDTIVISKSGTIGKLGILKDYMCGNRATINIRTIENVAYYRFIFYHLLRYQAEIEDMAVGSVQRNLYTSILGSINLNLPPLPEQKSIAATLSCLDDKIELNNHMNKNLEEMAQAIFKSWFVDFEPFKEGEFEDSELGLIPKGWRVTELEKLINIHDDKRKPISGKQRENMKGTYSYYGAASQVDSINEWIYDGIYLLVSEDGANVVDDNGIPLLQYVWGKFWVNNHAHVITGKGNFSTEFIKNLLMTTNMNSIVTGAAQPKINQNNMRRFKVLKPSEEVVIEYSKIVTVFYEKYRNLIEESKRLTVIRDTLLPKLMSGEVRVPIEEVQ